MKKVKTLSLLLALVMLLSVFSPSCFAAADKKEPPISMSVNEDGKLSISRRDIGSTPMGDEDTWTIFVYICGANLESEGGYATDNIIAMQEGENPKNCRFIVQTGGSYEWQNSMMQAGEIGRYEICDGYTYELAHLPDADMSDRNTLIDFLEWGVENYPAEKMGLILWNHGGGSISGVCFDEVYDDGSISLNDLNIALDTVSEKMTDKFEFIGFDACLMATMEAANILATYARYMYASEEVEPGCGWNYLSISEALAENPGINGAELGEVLISGYYDLCVEYGSSKYITFSIIDLSLIDDVLIAFNDYCKDLYEATGNNEAFVSVTRQIRKAEDFGGNNRNEGYANMIDVAGFADAGAEFSDNAQILRDAIYESMIKYGVSDYHPDVEGLSMYFPLHYSGDSSLSIFHSIATSPYYLAYVDRMAYSMSRGGNLEKYTGTERILESWSKYWSSDAYLDPQAYLKKNGMKNYIDSYTVPYMNESDLFSFDEEPAITEDGTAYCFTLSEEGYLNLDAVFGSLYWYAPESEEYISLGWTGDVNADWDSRFFYDNFNGYWLALEDGQNLVTYLVQEDTDYAVYSCPILLNEEETNLRVIRDYKNNYLYMAGCWDGLASGMASRNWINLVPGDIIQPIYQGDENTYFGAEYVYEGKDDLTYAEIFDGQFYYAFVIQDVYGNYIETDYISIVVDEGEITFSPIQ